VRIGKPRGIPGGARPDFRHGERLPGEKQCRRPDCMGLKGPGGLWSGGFNFATTKGGKDSTGGCSSTTKATRSDAPPKPRMARRLSHVHGPIWNRGSEQLQHFDRRSYRRTYTIRRVFQFVEHLLFQPKRNSPSWPIFVYQRAKDGNPRARLEPMDFIWGEAGGPFSPSTSPWLSEAGFDRTKSPSGQYEGLAAQGDIARKSELDGSSSAGGSAYLSDLCKLGRTDFAASSVDSLT